MKATLRTPNTLGLALWTEQGRSVILGNIYQDGEPLEVLADSGNEPYALLARCMEDVASCCARHVILYTNDEAVATTYRKPIQLEPTAPDRQHLTVPTQWEILRRLCGYQSWQIVQMEKLPKTKAYWEKLYGRHA